jgi:hypothetical protein
MSAYTTRILRRLERLSGPDRKWVPRLGAPGYGLIASAG